jgi:hypothetical protein
MTEVPRYQTEAARRPVIGFVRISQDEVLATGVTIEQLKLLIMRQDTNANAEIETLSEETTERLAQQEWRTVSGRLFNREEQERSLSVGVISIKGPDAERLLQEVQSAFGLLLRSELHIPFVE